MGAGGAIRTLSVLACVVACACGEDDVEPDEHCTAVVPLVATSSQATVNGGEVVYQGVTSSTDPYDLISITVHTNAVTGPGRIELGGTPADCDVCVYLYQNCQQNRCSRSFFAFAGEVALDSLGGGGERLAGSFVGVELQEVEWHGASGQFVESQGGPSFCADGFAFDAAIVDKAPEPACVAAGTGVNVGHNIADFTLQSCTGESFELHSLCGQVDAIWLMPSAGWCRPCGEAVAAADDYLDALGDPGLELVVVLGDDADGAAPSQAYCQQWAAERGVNPARVYIDHGDTWGAWETTFTHINPYMGTQMTLPWSAVLRGVNMEYVFAESYSRAEASEIIDALLNE